MRVEEVHGDLLDQDDVDALVNAWNRNVIPWWLLIPQGVSGALKRRAGAAPFRELGYAPLPLGHARVTSAGRLPHAAIIHVAGINLLWTASEASIRGSVRSAVHAAVERGFTSIALPVLGAGSGRFKEPEAAALILDTLAALADEGVAPNLLVRLVRYAPG